MPIPDLIRESFVGQLIYRGSGRRWFQYIEDRPEFVLPGRYKEAMRRASMPDTTVGGRASEAQTLVDPPAPRAANDVEKQHNKIARREGGGNIEVGDEMHDEADKDWLNIVDWYGPDDPECPMNVGVFSIFWRVNVNSRVVVTREALFRNI
jgi:DHA1 family multidrug resistance protein-like MFS transporter